MLVASRSYLKESTARPSDPDDLADRHVSRVGAARRGSASGWSVATQARRGAGSITTDVHAPIRPPSQAPRHRLRPRAELPHPGTGDDSLVVVLPKIRRARSLRALCPPPSSESPRIRAGSRCSTAFASLDRSDHGAITCPGRGPDGAEVGGDHDLEVSGRHAPRPERSCAMGARLASARRLLDSRLAKSPRPWTSTTSPASAAVTTVRSSPPPPASPSGEACFVTTGSDAAHERVHLDVRERRPRHRAQPPRGSCTATGPASSWPGSTRRNPKQVLARLGVKSLSFLATRAWCSCRTASSSSISRRRRPHDRSRRPRREARGAGGGVEGRRSTRVHRRSDRRRPDLDARGRLRRDISRHAPAALSQGTTDADPTFRGQEVLVARDGDIVVLGEREAPLHDPCGAPLPAPARLTDGNNLVFLHRSRGQDRPRARRGGRIEPEGGWKVLCSTIRAELYSGRGRMRARRPGSAAIATM